MQSIRQNRIIKHFAVHDIHPDREKKNGLKAHESKF